MTIVRNGLPAVVLVVAVLGLAGCGNDQPSAPANGASAGGPQSELSSIQTTLDNVDREIAGDDSP